MLGITALGLARGVALAVPSEVAWRVAGSLEERGSVKRGYLGILSQPVHLPSAQSAGLGEGRGGLLVVGVEDSSPAGRGELRRICLADATPSGHRELQAIIRAAGGREVRWTWSAGRTSDPELQLASLVGGGENPLISGGIRRGPGAEAAP